MMKRLIGAACVGLIVAALAFASPTAESSGPETNPYAALYVKNVSGMKAPDQSLDGILPPDSDLPFFAVAAAGAQASRTCSQRCSTTCSTTCTTTRGCSSNCKRQTDGCGGAVVPAPAPAPRQQASAVPPTSARITADLTARIVVNAQRALVIAGYEGLCLDGTNSSAFTQALQDFQLRQNIAATGALTQATWMALQPLLNRAGGVGAPATQQPSAVPQARATTPAVTSSAQALIGLTQEQVRARLGASSLSQGGIFFYDTPKGTLAVTFRNGTVSDVRPPDFDLGVLSDRR